MRERDQRLAAATNLYLEDGAIADEFEDQIISDIDLVRQCYQVALKHAGIAVHEGELSENVTDEVLTWYPEATRKRIASLVRLERNTRSCKDDRLSGPDIEH